jgi:hypothetical protein
MRAELIAVPKKAVSTAGNSEFIETAYVSGQELSRNQFQHQAEAQPLVEGCAIRR